MKKAIQGLYLSLVMLGLPLGLFAGGIIEDVDVSGTELTEDTEVVIDGDTLTLKGGTSALFYNSEGKPLYRGNLAKSAPFTVKGATVTVPKEEMVCLYESGALKYTSGISEEVTLPVQGKEVRFHNRYDVYQPLFFHPDGSVYQATLVEASVFNIQGKPVAIKGYVNFAADGTVLFGTLENDTSLILQTKEVLLPADTFVSFHETGSVKECGLFTVTETFLIQDKQVSVGGKETISFYEDGTFQSGYLNETASFTVQGKDIIFKQGTFIMFYPDASLSMGTMMQNATFSVQGKEVEFRADGGISFHANGEVRAGELASDTELEFHESVQLIRAGKNVEFEDTGLLKSIYN